MKAVCTLIGECTAAADCHNYVCILQFIFEQHLMHRVGVYRNLVYVNNIAYCALKPQDDTLKSHDSVFDCTARVIENKRTSMGPSLQGPSKDYRAL